MEHSLNRFETGACFSCNSKLGECGQLGYYSDKAPGRGSLYLLTRDEEPFCGKGGKFKFGRREVKNGEKLGEMLFYNFRYILSGNQYKIRVMFTGTRIPIHTYGRIHILLIDENGLNETHTLTQ